MELTIRKYSDQDLEQMKMIWNEIVEEGTSFPEEKILTLKEARNFFANKTCASVALNNTEVVGLYIIQPNNIGRCEHIANASYGVKSTCRGKGIGKRLVEHSLQTARSLGFRIMQFNAVTTTNERAIQLYKKLGFTALGKIPGGFKQKDGQYVDIIPFFKEIKK